MVMREQSAPQISISDIFQNHFHSFLLNKFHIVLIFPEFVPPLPSKLDIWLFLGRNSGLDSNRKRKRQLQRIFMITRDTTGQSHDLYIL